MITRVLYTAVKPVARMAIERVISPVNEAEADSNIRSLE